MFIRVNFTINVSETILVNEVCAVLPNVYLISLEEIEYIYLETHKVWPKLRCSTYVSTLKAEYVQFCDRKSAVEKQI